MRKIQATSVLDTHVSVRTGRKLANFPGWSASKSDAIKDLRKLTTGLERKMGKLAGSKDYTDAGRAKRGMDFLIEGSHAISKWAADSTVHLTHEMDQLNAKLQSAALSERTTDPMELLRQEIRHAEIRRHIPADFDEVQAELLYSQVDPEIQEAMRDAPPRIVRTKHGFKVRRLVSEEACRRHALGQAQISDPESVSRLEDLQYMLDTHNVIAQNVQGEIKAQADTLDSGYTFAEATVDDGGLAARAGGAGEGRLDGVHGAAR